MARKVFVSSDIATDEALMDVAESDPMAQLLWPHLLTAFDDWGRLEASARSLKVKVFPANSAVTADLVNVALELYAKAGLLKLYSVDGKRYAAIDPGKWFDYQTHIRQEKRDKDGSHFPPPPRCDAPRPETARDPAHQRATARKSQPSPRLHHATPSPSPRHASNGSSDAEPARKQSRQKSDASTGPSLAPLVDAFRARSLPDPSFIGVESRRAQALLGSYEPGLIADCWSDYRRGAYGTDVDRSNLSFDYLARNNRIGNWRDWRDGGRRNGHAVLVAADLSASAFSDLEEHQ